MNDELFSMQSDEQMRIDEIRALRQQCRKDEAIRDYLAPNPNIKGDEGYSMPIEKQFMHFIRRMRLRRMIKRFEKDYGYTP